MRKFLKKCTWFFLAVFLTSCDPASDGQDLTSGATTDPSAGTTNFDLSSLDCNNGKIAVYSADMRTWVCGEDKDKLAGLNCSVGQVAKRNSAGDDWECKDDSDSLATLLTTCNADQIIKKNSAGAWVCESDLNTTALTGLTAPATCIGDAAMKLCWKKTDGFKCIAAGTNCS